MTDLNRRKFLGLAITAPVVVAVALSGGEEPRLTADDIWVVHDPSEYVFKQVDIVWTAHGGKIECSPPA